MIKFSSSNQSQKLDSVFFWDRLMKHFWMKQIAVVSFWGIFTIIHFAPIYVSLIYISRYQSACSTRLTSLSFWNNTIMQFVRLCCLSSFLIVRLKPNNFFDQTLQNLCSFLTQALVFPEEDETVERGVDASERASPQTEQHAVVFGEHIWSELDCAVDHKRWWKQSETCDG